MSFITNLGISEEIVAAVDINPHKWGKFMVGSNHRIVSPDELKSLNPDLIIAMNPIYIDEIGQELAKLSIDAPLLAL